jgi:hypothetical protein
MRFELRLLLRSEGGRVIDQFRHVHEESLLGYPELSALIAPVSSHMQRGKPE